MTLYNNPSKLIAALALLCGLGWSVPADAVLTTVGDWDFADNMAPAGFTEFGDPTYAGGKLLLDGVGDYIQAPAPTTASDNMVLETIVSADAFGAFNFSASISNADGSNTGYGILGQGGEWRAINSGVGYPGAVPHGTTPTSTVALAYVREGGDSSLWVNGVQYNSGGADAFNSVTDAGVVTIAGHEFDVPNGVFDGAIDRVRVSTFAGSFDPNDLLGPRDGTIGVSPTVIADLAADYDETGAIDDVTSGVISTALGTWTYSGDSDLDPSSGLTTLLFRDPIGLDGGDGYGGSDTIFGFIENMPAISDDGLFDGASPNAGELALHPGDDSPDTGVLVAQFTASAQVLDVEIEYSFRNLTEGDGTGWYILDDDGNVLASGGVNNSVTINSVSAPDLAIGDSIFLLLDNGPGNDPGGDQTFTHFRVTGTLVPVPEPATATLGLLALGGLGAMTRRRRA